MILSVLLCSWMYFLVLQCGADGLKTALPEVRYECGAHGKFEYCIDGVPGCVVGCHCHPGYYFDTDTKICEPNIKLTRDFPWRYMTEPTRINLLDTRNSIDNAPTPTTANIFNEKDDEIAKETDEIGDWLYKQFFETLETQITNNTKIRPSNLKTNTRRSGDDVFKPKGSHKDDTTKKKPRRVPKRHSKRQKKKKVRGLRRKLLRITEDDSLFDSSSESNSPSESDSSDDESNSSSSSSSDVTETSKEKDKNDAKHGHKKIIIYNRRPRPPLPSFIFLPNMDTPYFPPAALPPPPPVLPMYPLIPIPPMAPVFPFSGPPNSDRTTTATSTNKATEPSQTITDTTTEISTTEISTTESTRTIDTQSTSTTTTTEVSTTGITEASTSDSSSMVLRSGTKWKKHKSKKTVPDEESPDDSLIFRSNDANARITAKQFEEMKLIQLLRDKLKKKSKHRVNKNNDENYDPEEGEALSEEMASLQDSLLSHYSANREHKERRGKDSKLKDFKYISELIHKMNHSADSPTKVLNVQSNINNNMAKMKSTRRDYNPSHFNIINENVSVLDPRLEELNDTYFAHLGRQIAYMIRYGEPQATKSLRSTHTDNHSQMKNHIITENSFTPRSFWERYVRSPLKHISYKNDENILSSLENEFRVVVSTEIPPSLQELENTLNKLKDKPAVNKESVKPKKNSNSHKPFNINRLFKLTKTDETDRPYKNSQSYAEYLLNIIKDKSTLQTRPEAHHNSDAVDIYLSDNQYMDVHKPKREPNNSLKNVDSLESILTQNVLNNYKNYDNMSVNNTSTRYTNSAKPSFLPQYIESPEKYSGPKRRLFDQSAKRGEFLSYYYGKNEPTNYPESTLKYLKPADEYPKTSAKMFENMARYSNLQQHYAEIPVKYHEVPKRLYEMVEEYPKKYVNYSESPTRLPAMLPKQPERNLLQYFNSPIEVPEQRKKIFEVPTTQSVTYPLSQYLERSSKFSESKAKHSELPAINSMVHVKYLQTPDKIKCSEPIRETSEMPSTHLESPVKYLDSSTKYPNPDIKYSETPTKFSMISDNMPSQYHVQDTEHTQDATKKYILPVLNLERTSKQPEQYTNFSDHTTNNPYQTAKYSELLPTNLEPHAKFKINLEYPALSVEHSEPTSNQTNPETHFDQLINYSNPPVNITNQSTEYSTKTLQYSNSSEKYVQATSEYPSLPLKKSELSVMHVYPGILVKYSASSVKPPQLSLTNRQSTKEYYEPFGSYAKYSSDFTTKTHYQALINTERPDLIIDPLDNSFEFSSAKDHETAAKFSDIFAIYPELPRKYQELVVKFPESPSKYTEISVKYPDPRTRYQEIFEKYQPSSSFGTYKNNNYFSDPEGKDHYVFKTYPIAISSFGKRFSKTFELNKPSYFRQNTLHNFDYF